MDACRNGVRKFTDRLLPENFLPRRWRMLSDGEERSRRRRCERKREKERLGFRESFAERNRVSSGRGVIERRVGKTVPLSETGEGRQGHGILYSPRKRTGDDAHKPVEPLFNAWKKRRRKWSQFHGDLLHFKLAEILMIIVHVLFVCSLRRMRRNEILRRKLLETLPQESLERFSRLKSRKNC